MKIIKVLVLYFIAWTLLSCMDNKVKNPGKQFDIEEVRNIIREANNVYGNRFSTDDKTWYLDKYCEDACAMPEKMESVCGIDAIIKYYYDNGKNKDFKISIKEIEIYGNPEIVVEEGIYDFPDGKGGSFDKGKFIAVWKFVHGKWKIYREIWNSSLDGSVE
jgi:ketosteroid isomerase-like protein